MTYYFVIKRVIDIFGAVIAIIIFLPVKVVIALHIKRVSPEGPIFADIPLRVGKGGRHFKMFKFRSMIPNAHDALLADKKLYEEYIRKGYKIEAEKDPRLIPGAMFLRKSSMDELPQFFNVLFGHMSIVGPRAYFPFELEEQAERYPEAKEHIELLLEVKPGITGPWQVGGRNEIPFVERARMDADYAKKRSILYDLMIILKTPVAIITRRGAS